MTSIHHQDLIWFYQFTIALQRACGKYEPDRVPQYDYSIRLDEEGNTSVVRHGCGSLIDTLVSEMMIPANSIWAQVLDKNELPDPFRVQSADKVHMSTKFEPHIDMGVQHCGWFISPLRHVADYINQKQLISLINDTAESLHQNSSAELFAALYNSDATYTVYTDLQRQMGAYWNFVYLQQQGMSELTATILEGDLARTEGLPLAVRTAGIPFDALSRSQTLLKITELDAERQLIAFDY